MNKTLQRVLIAVFVVVDVVLIVGARRHVSQTPPASEITVASATPTAVPAGEQNSFDFTPAEAWTIATADDGSILYSVRGRCDDGDARAEVSVSPDGGKTMRTIDVGLNEVLALSAQSRDDLKVVGATADCEVQQRRSTDGGATWTTEDDVTLWHPAPDDAKTVVTPAGKTRPGCTVTSLSQLSNGFGRATCVDGTVMGSGDEGRKWVQLGRLDNVRVAAFQTFSEGYALAVYQGCAAQQFSTRDSGRTWTPGGCITGEPAQAIGVSEAGAAAIVDGQFYASADAGQTWTQP